MTLNDAELNQNLRVCAYLSPENDVNDIESRLMHFGFIPGARVRVTKKAPLFKEPLLVEVRGRLIALTKDEAHVVRVEVFE